MKTSCNALKSGVKESSAYKKRPLTMEMVYTREELSRHMRYISALREGIFHMLRDIDGMELELDAAQMRLKKTQIQLMHSSRLKALGELSAGLAHEINQPLTVIMGLSQNLLQKCAPEDPDYEKLQLIAEAAKRTDKIIKHLRIFSRNEDGTPRREPVDINGVIRSAFLILSDTLASSAINVEMNLSDVPLVRGSATRLEQVVVNLVTNARDVMPQGGTLGMTTQTLEKDGANFVMMSVSDTGCGIPDEIRDNIFEPFFTSKKTGEGTGLGLSISSAIINEHQGAISFESTYGKGTTFHVTFPALA
ncbi:MAG: hypothetical protein HZB82_06635 [Deltaproteobacteria bacterium]|nr:hypothetical protein [Deltaproteobacteria bacterium]